MTKQKMDKIILAGCVILDNSGKLLLIHRNTPKRIQWETPGGKIDEGENPEDTAVREINEEIGIKVTIIKELGRRDFQEDGFVMEYIWYLAKVVKGEPKLMEPEKYDDLRYFSWEELDKLKTELSPNTLNLLNAHKNNLIDMAQ